MTTNAASSITTNSARLNGYLDDLGTAGSVTVSFVWGTTPGGPYPNETSGDVTSSTGAFYFDKGSLTPGTTYYYKAKADGDGSPVYGVERSFTTLTTPPAVTTNDASNVASTSARLNGNLTSWARPPVSRCPSNGAPVSEGLIPTRPPAKLRPAPGLLLLT